MKLAEIKRHIQVGSKVLCVENTYRPELNGRERTIVKTQTNAFVWSDGVESRSWTRYPKASGVRSVDATTFDLNLEIRSGDEPFTHYVRLRLLGHIADEDGPCGHCDTCGAPCDRGGCTKDRSHEIAL